MDRKMVTDEQKDRDDANTRQIGSQLEHPSGQKKSNSGSE